MYLSLLSEKLLFSTVFNLLPTVKDISASTQEFGPYRIVAQVCSDANVLTYTKHMDVDKDSKPKVRPLVQLDTSAQILGGVCLYDDKQNGKCRPCGRKRCQCCKMITSAGTVKSSSGATVRPRQNTDCTTENIVYLISCSSCNKQYVRETKGPLNKRMNGHPDDWRHRRFERSPTAEHFHCRS